MDGLQRLSAIADFYENMYSLEGLEQWPELTGRTYNTLPDQVRKGIDRRYLSAVILLHETAKTYEEATRLKQLVFERINSGGVDLSPQESRNALYPGPMNSLCLRLARNTYLCRMWGIPEPDDEERISGALRQEVLDNESFRKMDDVELVLRFFAHRQRARLWRSKTNLRTYFDNYLRSANLFPDAIIADLEEVFNATVKLAYQVLGEQAFRLYRKRGDGHEWVNRTTVMAYDPVMSALSHLLDKAPRLIANAEQIRSGLADFYVDHQKEFDGRKVNPPDLKARDELMIAYLSRFS
jgi:hypothetical protein